MESSNGGPRPQGDPSRILQPPPLGPGTVPTIPTRRTRRTLSARLAAAHPAWARFLAPLGRWGKHRGVRYGAAAVASLLLVSSLLLLLPSQDEPDEKFVAVYFTDLPGGYERLQVVIAGVTVGQQGHALAVELPEVELSSLQGPQDALKVASGWVPLEADGQVAIVFASARGYKEGEWETLEVPQSRLVLRQGLPPGQHRSNAALFDFNLETSLVQHNETITFEPLVQNVTQVSNDDHRVFDNSTHFDFRLDPNITLNLDLDQILKVELPPQHLDNLATDIVDELCRRVPTLCVGPPPECVDDPQSCQEECLEDSLNCVVCESCTTGNQPPLAPSNPLPDHLAPNVDSSPTLSWVGGDPDGDAVTYVVNVDGEAACGGSETKCALSNLAAGSTHTWQVTAKDVDGLSKPGPVWTFTVFSLGPPPPSSPTPADNAPGQPLSLTLWWVNADAARPSGDVQHRVLWGKGSTPAKVICDWGSQLSCLTGTLEAEASYAWRVDARDASSTVEGPVWKFQTRSKSVTNEPPNAASAPRPAHGEPSQALSATLEWTGSDPDGNALTHRVLWGTTAPPTEVKCDWSAAAKCSTGALAGDTTYYWRVESKDVLDKTPGPIWSFTTLNTAPNLPGNPSPATDTGDVALQPATLSWTGGDPDGTTPSYRVLLGESNPPTSTACDWGSSAQCTVGPPLKGYTKYYWRVEAKDARDATTQGPVWSFTTLNRDPNAPASPSPASGNSGLGQSPRLSWTGGDPDGHAVTYEVLVDGTTRCAASAATSCNLSGLDWGTEYSWTVRATDAAGKSVTGGPWTFETNRYPNQASSPGPSNGAQGQSFQSVTLSWAGSDPDSGESLQYRVVWGTTSNPTTERCAWQTATTCTLSSLLSNYQYYWRVTTKDGQGLTTDGPVWSFHTMEDGSVPYCVGDTCIS